MYTRSQLKHMQCEYPVGDPFGGPAYGRKEDFIFGGDDPPPPDNSALAAASEESARIAAELGREQLAESRRQYDINSEVAQPVIAAQLELMDQTKQQGDEYFNYWKTNAQPVEGKLNEAALREASPEYAEEMANRAMADTRQGTTQQMNQLIRQGLRYGYSPSRLAALSGSAAVTNALGISSAANQARTKQRDVGYAKMLDVAGLYRGMPGASQGAYGLALNSGNSAVGNSLQPGNQLLSGMAQGAGTQMSGQGLRVSGLGNILNAQTSYANNLNANSGGGLGAMMGLAGRLGSAYLMAPSDRRLKENIKPVGVHEPTDLTLYQFSYKDDPECRRFIGVMADEVEPKYPDAVKYDDLGFASVDYGKLGITMVEV